MQFTSCFFNRFDINSRLQLTNNVQWWYALGLPNLDAVPDIYI